MGRFFITEEDLDDFYILVDRQDERDELQQWISNLPDYTGDNVYFQIYFRRLPNMKIISLQEVKEHLDAGEEEWSRIETIPF